MSFPPETPQDYCDYFQGLVSYGKPPDLKWQFGLKASQLWKAYCEQDGVSDRNQLLISIVKILMPVRLSGSGLLDLWQRVLRRVAELPVDEQERVWVEVFNVTNQGEAHIAHNEAALEILQEWIELDKSAETAPIDKTIMNNMVSKVYLYTFSGYDWIAFTVAISEWFKRYIEEPSFYDSVCDRFGKKTT